MSTTAVTTEAPAAPVRTTVEGDRSLKTQQVLRVVDGVTTAVQVSTSHNKERKQITSFASRVTIHESTQGFTVTRSVPMEAVLLGRTPVARYSKGALLELHNLALMSLDDCLSDGNAVVTALFA